MPRSPFARRTAALLLVAAVVPHPVAAQVASSSARRAATAPVTRMIDMGGYRLRVRTAGDAAPGRPTVVFESGLGTPLETWAAVQRDLARETATFTYDRAGIGGSEPGRAAPTHSHIADELHALLAKSGTRAPYVLVGHSMGGPVIRLFVARYPREVAGLVYVDATDFTLTPAAEDSIWAEAGVPDGRSAFAKMQASFFAAPDVAAGVRAEAQAAMSEWDAGFPTFRDVPPAAGVPTVVLIAGRNEPFTPIMAFPGGAAAETPWFSAWVRQRMAHQSRWASAGEQGEQGTVVLTPYSSHYIHDTEPELVTWAVHRAMNPNVTFLLTRMAARAGADSILALYDALRRSRGKAAFTEGSLNAIGYQLLGERRLPDAIAILRRNVAEYPNSANPYDSLGEAYMVNGERALAMRNYERSLALDPNNINAKERLKTLRAQ